MQAFFLVYDRVRITTDNGVDPELIKLLENGFASQQQGDLKSAEQAYLKVLKRDEQNEFALNLMGVVCVRSERPKEAIEFLTKALLVNSNDPETHNNLGLAYKELKRFDEARSAFESSVKLNPEQPATLNNLGNILASVDSHDEAISHFEAALTLDRQYIDCLNNLSVSLKEVGRLDHALQVADLAISLDPARSLSHNYKGEVLLQMTKYETAKSEFEHAIELDGNIVAKTNLSTALKQLGDEQAAVRALQDVLDIEPNNAEALNSLGVLYEQLGDMDQAANHFRRAIKSVPNHASSYYQLSKLKDQRLTTQEINKINQMLDDPQLLDIFKSSLYFALACDFEKAKDYESSIGCFLRAQEVKANRNVYDESVMTAYIEESTRSFPLELSNREPTDDLPTPIFIVGMPRSGTTLTEQIISSHSEIEGAGEVGFINDLAKTASEMTSHPYPKSLRHLTSDQAASLRNVYLERMVKRCGGKNFVVDKNPLNFNFVGFIASVFPEARILHCKRDAMDNCVSIFRLPFDDNQGYSHDLASLGIYYRQHEKLMEFWTSCYADQILQVNYEETVENLEDQARVMLDFIGVDFEEQVLDFFDNERIVMTPSAEQVRQPIYKTSINAWKRYGDAINPLSEALRR